jgi:cysteine desulfurase
MKNIYLDNAATTRVDSRVIEAMMPYYDRSFGNASSVHSYGRQTKVLLEDARETLAKFIGAKPSEIYFTSGGTEANNFAIKGLAFQNFGKRNHIISTKIEHSSVLDTLEYIKNRFGFQITFVPVNKFGQIDLQFLNDSIKDQTFLISIMHSNNELGVINDVSKIAEIIGERRIVLHTDSVQSIGKTKFNVSEIGCTTAAMSAHKIYGPKGTGALFIKRDTAIDKLIHGGMQERDRRGGTENIPAIAGFKKAIEILSAEMGSDIEHYSKLKNYFVGKLKSEFSERIIINSLENESSLPNIVNISFNTDLTVRPGRTVRSMDRIDADTLLIKLDLQGIAVSSGSACTSGSIKPSHVLKATGYDDETAKSSLRISFGRENTEEDVDYLIRSFKDILGG